MFLTNIIVYITHYSMCVPFVRVVTGHVVEVVSSLN